MSEQLPSLPAPMSEGQLRSQAASQIDLEISQAVAPIQSQITTTQQRSERALGQIGGMFDALQPVVQQAANAVQSGYDQASQQEASLFANAQSQLQANRANRAAEAQQMAQMVGGPVAMNEWTNVFDDASTDLTMLGAGQQLHTLAYAQAGMQQAQQFAGQIFPLVRTEQMATVRNGFEEQIREYEDQITALQSQKGAQVNKRYNELRTQELQYGLQRAQYELQKLDSRREYDLQVKQFKADKAEADRTYKLDKQKFYQQKKNDTLDYSIAKRTLANDTARIRVLEKEFDLKRDDYYLRQAELYGESTAGKKTLAALAEQHRHQEAAAQLGLSKDELKARIDEARNAARVEKNKLTSGLGSSAATLLENAITPKAGTSYTTVKAVKIPEAKALNALRELNSGVYIGDNGDYYMNVETTQTTEPMPPISDPSDMVDYVTTGVHNPQWTKADSVALVRSRLANLPASWKYGDKWPPTGAPKAKPGETLEKYIDRVYASPDTLDPRSSTYAGKAGSFAAAHGGTLEKRYNVGSTWNKNYDPIVAIVDANIGVTKSKHFVNVKTGKYVASREG